MNADVRPTGAAFLRLDAQTGWQTASAHHVFSAPGEGTLQLGQPGVYPIAPTEPMGSFGGLTLPRGLTSSPQGQLFLADPDGHQILTWHPGDNLLDRPSSAPFAPFRPLWQPPTPAPAEPLCELPPPPPGHRPRPRDAYHLDHPRDVLFTRAGELVIADTGHQRLLVLCWPGLQVRHQMTLNDEPWALAEDHRGRVLVLLRNPARTHCRLIRLDRLWRQNLGFYLADAALSPGCALLAVSASERIHVLDPERKQLFGIDPVAAHHEGPWPVQALPPDTVFGQRFVPALTLEDGLLWHHQADKPDCPALALDGLSVDRLGYLSGTRLPLLARPRRIALPREGEWRSQALDGTHDHWPWHRLRLQLTLPANTRLWVQTCTDNAPLDEQTLAQNGTPWSEPLSLQPGEIPEILVQSPPGRYLWLRLSWQGDGFETPRIQAIEIEAPRRSALRFLPPPFHDDALSRDFLDRYLSYFDNLYAEIEHEIDHFARYLDPYSVPAGEFLDWLGRWMDLRFLAEWPADLRREMIAQAIVWFRERGTLAGLRRLLGWHTGLPAPMPQIIEHFRLRAHTGPVPVGGRPLVDAGVPLAHRFSVVLPAWRVPDAASLSQLEALIDAQKPAHTHASLRLIEPGIRIGCQSTIGVDTLLGTWPDGPLDSLQLDAAHLDAHTPARRPPVISTHSFGSTGNRSHG